MKNSNTHNERIAKMTFASVHPMYIAKIEKKSRTKEELHQVVCRSRVEEIEDPLTQQVRYLDKLVDELAKGRKMEKILRGS